MSILLNKLQDMLSDAKRLDSLCDTTYNEILNIEPFQGPYLERELRKVETEVKKLCRKADGLSDQNEKISFKDVDKVKEIWDDLRIYLNSCESTLSAGREHLEDASILVFLGKMINEMGKLVLSTIQIVGTEIQALLPKGK
jgi:hypothetical protein